MTPEQKASYIFSQCVCVLSEIEAMKAENKYREMKGETIAYKEGDFLSVIDRYGISHSQVINFLS
jgi:hypothetical protein